MKLDDLHFSFREVDSYNKPFNFIISEREAGKTTAMVLKMWKAFQENRRSLILRRQAVDITDLYIDSIQNVLNKFIDTPIEFTYKRSKMKDGMLEVYVNDKLFFWVVALSSKLQRLKSLMLPGIKYIFFDEFIVNMKLGERYLQSEEFKFKEIFNTFQREARELKCYFLGNPYSHFNPYFVDFGVKTSLLKPGARQIGPNWIVECYQIKDELKEFIVKNNPLYIFDNSYTKYAFGGQAIDDANILIVEKQPQNFSLCLIFKYNDKFINVYKTNKIEQEDYKFWINLTDTYEGKRRNVFCIDWRDMANNCYFIDAVSRDYFWSLRNALQVRTVAYQSIEASYMLESIYPDI